MSEKTFELSQKVIDKLNKEATKEELEIIYSMFHKKGIINHLFTYLLNSSYARGADLQKWITAQKGNDKIKTIAKFCKGSTHNITMINVLKYWGNKKELGGVLTYKGDLVNYGKNEYWATITEILEKLEDDCDGFMTCIYLTALEAGIPDYRLFCTCGNVIGGGHAYVTYIADNLVMYAIDGCYYPKDSVKLNTPYFENPKYYYGSKEWWRFNSSGKYKLK